MKTISLQLFFQLFFIFSFASSDKKNGPVIINSTSNVALQISEPVLKIGGPTCECWIERDSTWNVVPFDGSGGGGSPGVPPEYRNDDWCTPVISIPFNFCFYGLTYNELFINNNGNISFDTAYSTFSADSFPSANFKMIAPFWADIDTRDTSGGIVYYKLTNTALIVQWDNVGYFGAIYSLKNTFQVIITDGNDPIINVGSNVSFCFKEMRWTTGDASGGVNGFGGIPATVGMNAGNGINCKQVGRFDISGAYFDGSYGQNDGVDYLDNKSFTYGICSTTNDAPIFYSTGDNLCDTIEVCVGDTAFLNFSIYAGNFGQTVTPTINYLGLSDCGIIQSTSANIALITGFVLGQQSNIGYHTIFVTGTDNGFPQLSATAQFVVHIKNVDATFTYLPSSIHIGDTVVFAANSHENTSDVWNFGDGSPEVTGDSVSHVFTSDAIYNVTLNAINDGCQSNDSSTQQITVLSVGINESLIDSEVSLSPNPSNGVLLFKAKDNSKRYSLEIIDIQGRIVYHDLNLSANNFIDINYLENGLYFYKISNSNSQLNGQFLKQ